MTVLEVTPTVTAKRALLDPNSSPPALVQGNAVVLQLEITDPGQSHPLSSWTIDWGDNTSDQIVADGTNSLRSQTISHVYTQISPPGGFTIQATAVSDALGQSYTAAPVLVDVLDTPPTVAVTGPAPGFAGVPYGVELGPVADPDDGSVLTYEVSWGDGTIDNTVSATTGGQLTHVYSSTGSYSVGASVVDQYGSTRNLGNLPVTVLPAPAFAGQPYTVTLGPVTDPGDETVSTYLVNWGDGTAIDSITASQLAAADGKVTHTYADSNDYTISVELVDENGNHPNAGQLEVTVLPTPVYDFALTTFTTPEGDETNTTTVVQVIRSGNTDINSTVDVVLAAGAESEVGFAPGPITLNFAPDEVSKSVPIEIFGDTTVELDKLVALSLSQLRPGRTGRNRAA